MLITDEWRQKNKDYHDSCPEFGGKARKRITPTINFMEQYGAKSVLDYGCGKGGLVDGLIERGIDAQGYDPCVERFSAMPKPADFIVFYEGPEHIEEECVDDVLAHVASLTNTAAWIVTALRPARDKFPDGTNAHICVKERAWWLEKFSAHFARVVPRPCKQNDILDVLCFIR